MTTLLLLYLIAGGLGTAIDVGAYNLLVGAPLKLGRLPAHLISTAFAMLFGFALHFLLVFRPAEPLLLDRIPKYVLTVCFSAYLLQSFIIWSLSSEWRAPAQLFRMALVRYGIVKVAAADVVERNFVKICAVSAGLVFNFASFRYFVFARS